MNQTQNEKFRKLLADFQTAVLITHGGEDAFRARPMAIARVDENCDLWFVTSRDSAKAHEIEMDTWVQVICQNGWSSCVCISGYASLNFERAKIRELWNASLQVWFPKGVDDPEIVLIQVVGELGEYWDNTGINRVTYAYQAIKALVTGTVLEVKEGDQHGRMKLVKH